MTGGASACKGNSADMQQFPIPRAARARCAKACAKTLRANTRHGYCGYNRNP